MKKAILVSAIGLAFGVAANAQAAIVLTFADNTTPSATFGLGGFTQPFAAGMEFRMVVPNYGSVGGGGEKTIISNAPGQTWSFDATNRLASTSGFPGNPGAGSAAGSAAPTANTNPTLGQPAGFFGSPFAFLAPTTTSLAGTAYGPATITATATTMNIHFNVMEAQWGGVYFPMANVNLGCTVSGSAFTCFGEHTITAAEDTAGGRPASGFTGWHAQYNLVGTATGLPAAVPVPAAAWLLGSGLVGLVGVARRRKTVA